MSKKHDEVIIPERRWQRISEIVCDLCGKSEKGDTWAKDNADVLETTISLKEGWNYGTESGSVKTTSYDVCPTCFKSRLMPWLEAQGAEPSCEEEDW